MTGIDRVERPIFIVGCPRSGTGMLHQLVRLHPKVAWITPMTNWVCGKSWFRVIPPQGIRALEHALNRLPQSFLPPFLRGPHDGSLKVPGTFETHEGHSIWSRVFSASSEAHNATEDDISSDEQAYLHDVARWHCRYHRRPRFLSKTPRNLFRLRALRVIFPACFVVHLIRDGRAVVASILKRRLKDKGTLDQWWGVRPPGWKSVQARSPTVQTAWTWKKCLERAREEKAAFSDDHYLEVHYEKLVEQPETVLRRLIAALGLDTDIFFRPEIRKQLEKIHPPPETWRDNLSSSQKEDLRLLEPELRRQGYIGKGKKIGS